MGPPAATRGWHLREGGSRWVGSPRCRLDARAKVCQMEVSSIQPSPQRASAHGVTALRGSDVTSADCAQSYLPGMTEMLPHLERALRVTRDLRGVRLQRGPPVHLPLYRRICIHAQCDHPHLRGQSAARVQAIISARVAGVCARPSPFCRLSGGGLGRPALLGALARLASAYLSPSGLRWEWGD